VQAHPVEVQAQKRLSYHADVEASRAKDRARYQANIERERAKDRGRYAVPAHREKRRKKVTLTRDHIIPLGLPGASDSIDNIQPLCGPCNARKGRSVKDYRAAA
jgi:5-methylcytosine-specific restriction endonuclease McrA